MSQTNVLPFILPSQTEDDTPEDERLNAVAKIALSRWVHYSMPWNYNPFAAFQAASDYFTQLAWKRKESRSLMKTCSSLSRVYKLT